MLPQTRKKWSRSNISSNSSLPLLLSPVLSQSTSDTLLSMEPPSTAWPTADRISTQTCTHYSDTRSVLLKTTNPRSLTTGRWEPITLPSERWQLQRLKKILLMIITSPSLTLVASISILERHQKGLLNTLLSHLISSIFHLTVLSIDPCRFRPFIWMVVFIIVEQSLLFVFSFLLLLSNCMDFTLSLSFSLEIIFPLFCLVYMTWRCGFRVIELDPLGFHSERLY